MTEASARSTRTPTPADPSLDVRLVAADMDGTLLRPDGTIPDRLWPLLDRMRSRGILFVPASGRQYATLRSLFADVSAGMPFIAENGTYVVRDGDEIASHPLARDVVSGVLDVLDEAMDAGADLGAVVCGRERAYVSRGDEAFLSEARRYYLEQERVDDLRAVEDVVIKMAVFDFGDAEADLAPRLERFSQTHQVVVSGEHWVDVMAAGVDKGQALRDLQAALSITPAQTVAFGDYLNDLGLMEASGHAYAMANAHPRVIEVADHVAPSNEQEGVITVLEQLLG